MTRRRVLLVTPVSPGSTHSGAEQRSHLLWRAARSVGETDVLHLSEGAATQVTRADQAEAGRWLQAQASGHRQPWRRFEPNRPLTSAIEGELGVSLASYDLILGRYLWPISQLALPPAAATLVDLDDWRFRHAPGGLLDWEALRSRAKKSYAHWLAGRQLHRFDGAFAVTARDADEVSSALPSTLLPNVPLEVPEHVGPVPVVRRACFVGSLWYPPNRDAVEWLISAVWPRVRAALPDATLGLLGAAPAAWRERWAARPGVEATGFVEDLAEAYAASALVVAPIFSGGGTNIKVLEAMGHGRPCLTTPLVCAALSDQVVAGRHLMVAGSAPEFARRMIEALSDPAALQPLADEGRRLVQGHFSPSMFEQTAASFMLQVMTRGRQ